MQLGEFDYNQNPNMGINHNQLEFRGMQTLENYARYEGQWIKGTDIRQGKGKQIWPDGSIFEGWFKDSKADGYGRMIHNNYYVYNGYW